LEFKCNSSRAYACRLSQLAAKRGVALEWASSASSEDEEAAAKLPAAGRSGAESDDDNERLSISSDDEPCVPMASGRPGFVGDSSGLLGRPASQARPNSGPPNVCAAIASRWASDVTWSRASAPADMPCA